MERTLNIFDMDGTLFNSEGNTKVMKGSEIVKVLGHGEFNTHQLEPGHTYDHSDFRSAKLFRRTATPIDSVLNLAKSIIQTQGSTSKTIILSARSDFDDHKEFLETFRDHGFPIDQVYVERSGNLGRYMLGAKPNITKAVVLKKYLATGLYDEVRIWDDAKSNLETLVKLANMYPVRITGYLVDPHTGKISRYNSSHDLYEDLFIPKPEVTLNIARSHMPQVGSDFDGFLAYLRKNNVKLEKKWVFPSELKATQGDFDTDMVLSLMKANDKKKKFNPQVISSDNYILDGHHRWLSHLNAEKKYKIPVIQASVGILELLNLTNRYPKVEKRSLQASKDVIKGVLKTRRG